MQEYTRKKIGDFLHSHTAYELIPESGKVRVVITNMHWAKCHRAGHCQASAAACGGAAGRSGCPVASALSKQQGLQQAACPARCQLPYRACMGLLLV